MNPNPTDLLATLAHNRWRLDCRHTTGEYRCLYYCAPCGLWRPVVDTGEYYADAKLAIAAAAQIEQE